MNRMVLIGLVLSASSLQAADLKIGSLTVYQAVVWQPLPEEARRMDAATFYRWALDQNERSAKAGRDLAARLRGESPPADRYAQVTEQHSGSSLSSTDPLSWANGGNLEGNVGGYFGRRHAIDQESSGGTFSYSVLYAGQRPDAPQTVINPFCPP